MDVHKNARLTPLRREREGDGAVGDRGRFFPKPMRRAFYGVSAQIVARWVRAL